MRRSLCLVAALALFCAAPSSMLAKPPNVLVVLSDDHSTPHLECYGNAEIKTPNFDAFANTAVRFNRAYVTCPP